jgi:hypothetical protein
MQESTTDETHDGIEKSITATVSTDSVVSALKLNATHGVDDRVIAVPQRDGAEAKIRRAFQGSERYSNPASAPIHIRPESLVDNPWTRPLGRGEVDCAAIGVPEERRNRDEEDEQRIDEAHDVLIDDWKKTVRSMIQNEHDFGFKNCQITLVGVEVDE